MNEPEICIWCEEPTECAGAGYISFFCTVARDIPGVYIERVGETPGFHKPLAKAGDEIGPLCQGCFERLDEEQFLVR